MDIDQQIQLLIAIYNLLLLNDEKWNQDDKTKLISGVTEYTNFLIQEKMGHDQYLDIPGESLDERPYDPGIFYDQPSKDIQNRNLEEVDSFEVALARRNQLCGEIGIDEERKDLNLEPQPNEEPLEQTFPCDIESLSTPL